MKVKCERCEREATVHLTEIANGEKIEKHLCEECAAAEGITVKAQVPLAKLLEGLAMQSAAEKELSALKCEMCGITFNEFRQQHLLGCPNDYKAFESVLAGLLERAHEGASMHAGKVPANAAADERKAGELLRLRSQLREAVTREQYERAAGLRDTIKKLEET